MPTIEDLRGQAEYRRWCARLSRKSPWSTAEDHESLKTSAVADDYVADLLDWAAGELQVHDRALFDALHSLLLLGGAFDGPERVQVIVEERIETARADLEREALADGLAGAWVLDEEGKLTQVYPPGEDETDAH